MKQITLYKSRKGQLLACQTKLQSQHALPRGLACSPGGTRGVTIRDGLFVHLTLKVATSVQGTVELCKNVKHTGKIIRTRLLLL